MAASFELQGPALQLGDIIDKFGVKVIEFTCQPIPETECARLINVAAEEATKTAMNAFEVLMSGRKSFPDKRTARYTCNMPANILCGCHCVNCHT